MDHHKLRTLVFEKTGIKVDSNDPIFALVALNETVLAESVGKHVALMDEASARFDLLARQLQAGGVLPTAAPVSPASHLDWRLLAGATAVALASALLVLAGQALFGHGNSTTAAAAVPAPAPMAALTPEQNALLQTGEKFNRALKRLDEPTRAKIQAEMRKP